MMKVGEYFMCQWKLDPGRLSGRAWPERDKPGRQATRVSELANVVKLRPTSSFEMVRSECQLFLALSSFFHLLLSLAQLYRKDH